MPKIKVEKQMNLEELIKYAKETSLKEECLNVDIKMVK